MLNQKILLLWLCRIEYLTPVRTESHISIDFNEELKEYFQLTYANITEKRLHLIKHLRYVTIT